MPENPYETPKEERQKAQRRARLQISIFGLLHGMCWFGVALAAWRVQSELDWKLLGLRTVPFTIGIGAVFGRPY